MAFSWTDAFHRDAIWYSHSERRPMTTIYIFFLLWIAVPCSSAGLLHRCPPKENITQQCTCEKNRDVVVTCSGLKRTHGFYKTIQSFRRFVIDQFHTENSGSFELISGLFEKLYMHSVTFDHVEFGSLPMLTFLNGLEESLEEFAFLNCKVATWIWNKGGHFHLLRNVRFDKTPLPDTLTKTMLSVLPRKIRHLQMSYCGIKAFGDQALRRFGFLERLELEGNHFTTITRSVIPFPARRLKYISFTNNPITALPKDMFAQMRRLEFLSLAATSLTGLEKQTFDPVSEQLEEIYLNNVRLKCDCEIEWLLNSTTNKIFRPPTCQASDNKRQRLLTEVTSDELCPSPRI